MIEVCAAAIMDREGRVLIARRTRPAALAGLWEFPGGKLEEGESGAACLVRELREELALEIEVGAALDDAVESRPGGGALRLTVYAARPSAGTEPAPRLVDGTHDAVRWVTAEELDARSMAPLDQPLLPAVRAFLHAPDAHLP